MKKLLAGLLVAATALAPLTSAYAQREGREGRGDRDRSERSERSERAPRGPEVRQMNREARTERREVRGDGAPDAPRREWRGNGPGASVGRTEGAPAYRPDRARPGGNYDRNGDGSPDRRWDRNRDGNVDRNWDRNGNGRVDRQWDRNRDGNLDRRWDRNDNNRLDRRYDRDRDGNLDRRYDRDRDGRYDRYDRRDNRSWNRSWRNDRRYNWYGHRNQYRDHYRAGRYYAPYRDHRYSRFSIGIRLGAPFYSNRYWINDPWSYRLPEVYGPYRWVRYYDDVLLVDIYTGQVVDVIHDFFW